MSRDRAASPPSSPFPGPPGVAAVWLALAVLLAYANSFTVPFIFDDLRAVTANDTIRSLATAWQPPAGGATTASRPVVNFSLALNYALGGETPWGYHAVNLLIHALAGLCLFGLIRRTLRLPQAPALDPGRADRVAFAAALLWLVHPLQTESVTSIAQRTESLCGLFYLLTLYGFVRGVGSGRPMRWWVVTVLSCLAGMGSKEVMVTAPVLLLLFDRTFVAGSFAGALRARWRLHAACAATWLWLTANLLAGGGSRGDAAGFGLGVAWWQYLLTQADAILLYLRLSLVPWPLVADYGTGVVGSFAEVWWQLPVVVALAAATLWAVVRRPVAGFLGAWFFVVLSPSSSVVPLVEQTVAEHRMYLPLAAVLTAAAWWLATLPLLRHLALLLPLAGAGIVLTLVRNHDYRSELALWQDTAAKAPDNMRAQFNTGSVLLESGRAAEAIPYLERAARLAPADAGVQVNLGNARRELGHLREAEAALRRALELRPGLAAAHYNLGRVALAAGEWTRAREEFAAAARLDPGMAEAHADLAGLLLQERRPAEAAAAARAALQAAPGLTLARRHLGFALFLLDRPGEAREVLAAVVVADPEDVIARRGLAFACARLGRRDEAIAHLRSVLSAQPDDAAARALFTQLTRNSP